MITVTITYYNMKLTEDKNFKWYLICVLSLVAVLVLIHVFEVDANVTGIVVIAISSLVILRYIHSFLNTKAEKVLFLLGYIFRLTLLFVDIYAPHMISFLHSREDSDGFFKAAQLLYQGEKVFYTNYPVFLSKLFLITGCNRMLAQYTNVIFFVMTVIVFLKLCRLKDIQYKYCLLGELIILFQPFYLVVSAFLMRESLIAFLCIISLYYLVLYHDKKKLVYFAFSIAGGACATMLHSGMIIILAVLGLDLVFYDNRYDKIRISKKTVLILTAVAFSIIIVGLSPAKKILFSSFIIPEKGGILGLIRYSLMVPTNYGGSDYLVGMMADNYPELIIFTFIKMVYFIASPVPMDFRGMQDALAFLLSSLPYMLMIAVLGYAVIKTRKEKAGYLLLFCLCMIIFFIGIYAWGVTNAGTAIRHRSKMIGVLIFGFVYALHCLDEKRRNTKL